VKKKILSPSISFIQGGSAAGRYLTRNDGFNDFAECHYSWIAAFWNPAFAGMSGSFSAAARHESIHRAFEPRF
jgi:hypothetical protein